MLNATPSKIVIEMKHIDHANYLFRALKKAAEEMGKGGDATLLIDKDSGKIDCGFLGHDVNIRKVSHLIEGEEPRE
jgi:hypothetical protein